MTNLVLTSKIEKLYEQDRQQNAEKTKQIRSEIFTKIPRIRSILEEIRSCSFSVSKYLLMGESGKEAAARERAKIESLRKERDGLLTRAGYPLNALDTIYTCSKCKDTGQLEDGSRCSCYKDKMRLLTK